MSPGDTLDAGHTHARCLRRPPSQAASHHYSVLTPRLAAATAVPDTTAPCVVSRHGPSVLPPWLVSGDAIVWPTPSLASAPAAAALGASWYGASRNYGTRDTAPAAAARRLPLCTAW